MPVFEWRSIMPVPVDELFAYHARPGAFERLAPPWQRLRILEQEGGMRDGGRVVFKVYVGPVGKRWVAEMGSYVEGRQAVLDVVQQFAGAVVGAGQETMRVLPRGEGPLYLTVDELPALHVAAHLGHPALADGADD